MAHELAVRHPYRPEPGAPARRAIRAAGLQLSGIEGDPASNVDRVELAVRDAAARGAQIMLTPEAFLSGYTDRERSIRSAVDVPGPEIARLTRLCEELNVYLFLGLVARVEGGFANSTVLVGPGGLEGIFSKAHINRYERSIGYTRGDAFPVWDLDIGGTPVRVGVMICYDREVPEAARLFMLQGVDILFNPLACNCPTSDIHRAIIRVRAYENEIFLVMVNHAAPRMNGHSFAVGPDGDILTELGEDEESYVVDLDLGYLDCHRKEGIYGFHHRRPELYALLTDRAGQAPEVQAGIQRPTD